MKTALSDCLQPQEQSLPGWSCLYVPCAICSENILLTGNAVFTGLVQRTGRLETSLAVSQADAKAICYRLVQLESQHSTVKARLSTAGKQRRRLTRQHAGLKKAIRRSDRQKAALQHEAVQLQQLLTSVMDMGCSMQQANSSMGTEMQLLRAELDKIQDQLAALQNKAESPLIKAGVGKGMEVAADDKGMSQTLKQVRPCISWLSGCTRMCCRICMVILASLACLLTTCAMPCLNAVVLDLCYCMLCNAILCYAMLCYAMQKQPMHSTVLGVCVAASPILCPNFESVLIQMLCCQVSYDSLPTPQEDIAGVEAVGAGGMQSMSRLSQPASPTSQVRTSPPLHDTSNHNDAFVLSPR